MNSLEIRDRQSILKQEANELIENARKEVRYFTEEETERYNNIKTELRSLKNELKSLEESLTNDPIETRNIINNKLKSEIKMEKRFSLVSAINAIANNRNLSDVEQAVISAGREEMRSAGMSFGGQIQLPIENRSVITVTNEGEDVVPTDLYDIMAPLRAKNVLVSAGAKFLTGLVGDVQIPIMTASNVGWAGETAAASETSNTFTHVTLSPKRLTAYVDISKQLLNLDAIGVEQMVRQDIVNAINSKLEATILGGEAGTSAKPAGIFYDKTLVVGLDSMAEFAAFEATVEAANVIGECKYIVAPSTKATLRGLAKGANIAQSLYSNGELDGTPVLATSHVAANKLVYGDFSNLAIGQFGAIDLTVDNYTQAVNGCVRLVINAYFDAAVLRSEAFNFGTTAAE